MTEAENGGMGELEVRSSPEIHLASSPVLFDIANTIETTPISFDFLAATFLEINKSRRGSFDISHLPGQLLEIHLQQLLNAYSGKNSSVDVNPIQFGVEKSNFSFAQRTKGMKAIEVISTAPDKRKIAEYDSIITVKEDDGSRLPVVFETKMGLKKFGHSDQSLSRIVRPQNLRRVLTPLQEYFETDTFGFVTVTNPELISSDKSPFQLEFRENGGIMVKLPITYEQYQREILRLKLTTLR